MKYLILLLLVSSCKPKGCISSEYANTPAYRIAILFVVGQVSNIRGCHLQENPHCTEKPYSTDEVNSFMGRYLSQDWVFAPDTEINAKYIGVSGDADFHHKGSFYLVTEWKGKLFMLSCGFKTGSQVNCCEISLDKLNSLKKNGVECEYSKT